jgi:hypothetical protein
MIRIGVTGHRFLAEIPKLETGIDQALTQIAQVYPGEAWSVVSSLAEGADRLVVRRVLNIRPDSHLIVPLPLPTSDYRQDFLTGQSQQEFEDLLSCAFEVIPPPQISIRSEGYWLAGKTMLAYSDVLVTLWDGQDSHGQGGTGEMVAIARQKKLPIAWVKCGNRIPGTNIAVSLGEKQGQLTVERLNKRLHGVG